MFTGLVESTAGVASLAAQRSGAVLELCGVAFADDLAVGDSVSVSGVCLTATGAGGGRVRFDLLAETLRATSLGGLAPGSTVNLERALAADGRLGGHIVQGHVDTTAPVLAYEPSGPDHRLVVALPAAFARYVCPKGSVAIDGISLTVASVDDGGGSMTVWITPHTHAATHLHTIAAGHPANLEFDIVAKYVERLAAAWR
jgi:riboflavin synthase